MAASKGSYRKKSNDKFLTYLIIGFAVVVVSLVVGLIISNIVNPQLDYDDFDYVTNYQQIQSQDESEYFVYYYSETCGYCQQIKNRVMAFSEENGADVKVYMMDAYNVSGYRELVFDPISGDVLGGTPALIAVSNGTIRHISSGYIEVLNTIDEVNDGTYDYIN